MTKHTTEYKWSDEEGLLEATFEVTYHVDPYRPATYIDPPEGGFPTDIEIKCVAAKLDDGKNSVPLFLKDVSDILEGWVLSCNMDELAELCHYHYAGEER